MKSEKERKICAPPLSQVSSLVFFLDFPGLPHHTPLSFQSPRSALLDSRSGFKVPHLHIKVVNGVVPVPLRVPDLHFLVALILVEDLTFSARFSLSLSLRSSGCQRHPKQSGLLSSSWGSSLVWVFCRCFCSSILDKVEVSCQKKNLDF